jgi:hypothetical protein
MKLMKIETVGSSAVTANLSHIIDISRVVDAIPTATTAVINYANAAGALKTITFTLTGASANSNVEKAINAVRVCDWFMGVVAQLNGPASNQKSVYYLGDHASMTLAAGLTFTGATTEPLTTIAFS